MYDASDATKLKARGLFWQGWDVAAISRELKVPYGTVDSWMRRDKWEETPMLARLDASAERRLLQLIEKESKSDRDYAEMGHLTEMVVKMRRAAKYEETGREADLNPKLDARAEGRKKKPKNFLTEEQCEALKQAFLDGLWGYQQTWWEAKDSYRTRNIIKSRQIGATWYFAREALIDAIESGDNQIFLSASKAQAHVFRDYIVQFVLDVTGVQLKGDPITLWHGATLYFLGTNSKTAQSYHGHVYMDEYAWIGKFSEFNKVASAMATHKKWRKTYFSTPSVIGHDAQKFWSGEHYNRGRPKDAKVTFDVSHAALKDGMLCADGQWRQLVTVEDAEAQGCDLFDIKVLHIEYNDHDFANLYMCEWVDANESIFGFEEMRLCMVDALDEWEDFSPHLARPFANSPVWIGYDPSSSGDKASIAVIAPPSDLNIGTFRLLEKIFVNGLDFSTQAERIRQLCQRYNVQHIGIDSTGGGQGVFQLVRQFYPAAREINYSVDVKNRLVYKAKQLIAKRRFAYDASHKDIAMAFLAIKRVATASGRQATFHAGRSQETGHADIAWAIMHGFDKMDYTDFDQTTGGKSRNIVEMSE
ncbi:MAG: oxidoreductase [Alphaproteobacteria bacterium]|nr:oxidoreductase [Alphaproteobacteria bacterium]